MSLYSRLVSIRSLVMFVYLVPLRFLINCVSIITLYHTGCNVMGLKFEGSSVGPFLYINCFLPLRSNTISFYTVAFHSFQHFHRYTTGFCPWSSSRFIIYKPYQSNLYYNLPYNPSAPFVRSGFLVSSFGDEISTKRSSLHMTYIQGICDPYKVSFEILPTYSELNG